MSVSISDLQISSQSRQYVRVPISDANGHDPTSDMVAMAFPTPGMEPSIYISGDWATLAGIYYARCLVGPGGAVQLDPGFYEVFVKITDNPEIPVLNAGLLEVT